MKEEKKDHNTTIAELTAFINQFRTARGWDKYNDPYDLSAALSVEASELLELLLWRKNEDVQALIAAEPKLKESLAEEIADVFTYTLTLCDSLGIDLTNAFYTKMRKNGEKFPVIDGTCARRKRWLE